MLRKLELGDHPKRNDSCTEQCGEARRKLGGLCTAERHLEDASSFSASKLKNSQLRADSGRWKTGGRVKSGATLCRPVQSLGDLGH